LTPNVLGRSGRRDPHGEVDRERRAPAGL
jgi:hypothetical protein